MLDVLQERLLEPIGTDLDMQEIGVTTSEDGGATLTDPEYECG